MGYRHLSKRIGVDIQSLSKDNTYLRDRKNNLERERHGQKKKRSINEWINMYEST